VKRVILTAVTILLLGNYGMAQDPGNKLSQQAEQVAVDAMLDRAHMALQNNEFAEAQKNLFSAMEIAKDSTIYARTKVTEANFFTYTGQLDQAQKSIDKLKKIIPKDSDDYIDLLLIQTEIYIKNRKYLQADEVLKTIDIVVRGSKNDNLALKADYLRADLHLRTANYTEAISIYQRIIPELESEKLFYYETKASFNLAETYFEQGNFNKANDAIEKTATSATTYGFNGIQHRYVKASHYFLLSSYDKPYYEDYLLPVGDLRESRAGAHRADSIVITKCPKSLSVKSRDLIVQKIQPSSQQNVYFSTIGYAKFAVNGNEEIPIKNFKGLKIGLLTGIAKPEYFVDFLKSCSLQLTHHRFSDHYEYQTKDLKVLSQYEVIITTEKDYVRLKKFDIANLYYVPIETEFLWESPDSSISDNL